MQHFAAPAFSQAGVCAWRQSCDQGRQIPSEVLGSRWNAVLGEVESKAESTCGGSGRSGRPRGWCAGRARSVTGGGNRARAAGEIAALGFVCGGRRGARRGLWWQRSGSRSGWWWSSALPALPVELSGSGRGGAPMLSRWWSSFACASRRSGCAQRWHEVSFRAMRRSSLAVVVADRCSRSPSPTASPPTGALARHPRPRHHRPRARSPSPTTSPPTACSHSPQLTALPPHSICAASTLRSSPSVERNPPRLDVVYTMGSRPLRAQVRTQMPRTRRRASTQAFT
jgi:hypothetical protein